MVNKWGAALLAVATVANAQKLLPISRSFGGGKVVKRGAVTFATDHELDMDYAEMGSYNSKDTDTFGATVHISTIDPDRKSTRLNSSHSGEARMPSSA